jgi:hypothetical protein
LTGEVDLTIEDLRIATKDGSLSASKAETLRRKVLGCFVNKQVLYQHDAADAA